MSERSFLMSSTVPFSDAKVPPLTPPLTRRTTSVVSVSSPAASCRTRTPMSDGIESKPQLWTMRAPLARAGASNRSIVSRMKSVSPVRST